MQDGSAQASANQITSPPQLPRSNSTNSIDSTSTPRGEIEEPGGIANDAEKVKLGLMFQACNLDERVGSEFFHQIRLYIRKWLPSLTFLCPRHSKNGGGALSVTPVRACVRPFVRPSVRYQNLVSAQWLLKKDCIDSIQIWYVDI